MDDYPNALWNKEQLTQSVARITPLLYLAVLLASTFFSNQIEVRRITLIRLLLTHSVTCNFTLLNQFNHG
ncbi:hypothetical protein GO755_38765 [Spirosoma sp. HMF4905]|uniref:Uncharacterized protein n=2 Tax=Spirosoma arboris TaxID=2682092 RepID=A0A7K1SQK2_9BACT|nr:hypothetical protein [Spirosoma arboris]